MRGVVLLLLSDCVIYSSGSDINLWEWNSHRHHSLLCTCERSQHGSVFSQLCFAYDCRLSGIKGRKSWSRPVLWWNAHSPLSGEAWERFFFFFYCTGLHALNLHCSRQFRVTRLLVGGRCIAQGLFNRSRRSWRTHADSNWWPFSFRKSLFVTPSNVKISLNKQDHLLICLRSHW